MVNSGPEIVSTKTERWAGKEWETTVVRHWGCKYGFRRDEVRWDPGYGSGDNVPYSEAEARADVARTPGGVLVCRTETTEIETTDWEVVDEDTHTA